MLKFELKYHFKQTSFQLACILFLALAMVTVAKGSFGGPEVYKNSAYVGTYMISFLSLFAIFSSTLFCANVVLRDHRYNMESVVYSTSVNRLPYFVVRLLGLLIAVFIHLCFAVIGLFVGAFFVESASLGQFNLSYYLYPLFVFGLPNVFLSVSCIFCAGLLTKNVRAIYAAGVFLYIGYMVASILGNSPLFATSTLKVNDPSMLPFLFDPFGMTSFFTETKKWPDIVKNYQLFPVGGLFLANRLIWLSVSSLIILITYNLFNFRLSVPKQLKTKSKEKSKSVKIPFKHFNVQPTGFNYNFYSFASQFKLELISLFKHIPFMVMLLLWLFVFGVELKDALFNGAYGIQAYPTTGFILEQIRSINFGLILIVFYAAELVGKEKAAKIEALIYSTPVRGGVLWAAKCLTLSVLVMVLVTLNIAIGISVQVVNGYFEFELLKYFSLYYYSAFPLLLFVVLIVFVQNLSDNKYLSLLMSMMVVLLFIFSSQIGINHFMLRFANVPTLQFSYFNGFGHYVRAFNWYMLYWSGFAIILAITTVGMWQGSVQRTFFNRLKAIPKTIGKTKFIFLLGVVVWLGSGVFIYHRTNVIGNYRNKEAKLAWQVNYEKKYASLAHLPQPIIKSVKTTVDLLTNDGTYLVSGTYRLRNETNDPIRQVWVSLDQSVNHFEVTIPNGENQRQDPLFNQQFINLKKPLLPNTETTMYFKLRIVRDGFVPFNTENSLSSDGTYIELEKYVPHFGFDESLLTNDIRTRRNANLPVKIKQVKVNGNYHLINLETVISTALDQEVVTVGTLQKSWVANKRRFFHYKTTHPINFMFALSSANYEIKMEKHKGINLSIYYRKGHEYNLNSMMKGVKEAIDYCASNFGSYPLKQFVLAEIPHYRGAATAYPGVVFSSEKINFLSNFNNPSQIDQAYAITTHEVAHQWWANKLDPANVAGRSMLTESLAKYTEAVLIEKAFGKMYLSNYFQLDNRLYFANRSPNEKELPMTKVIDQAYVYYQKGGINMYAVMEAVGEKEFNNVLKKLINTHENPNQKATTADFMRLLNEYLPSNQKKFVDDSFNQVVEYEMNIKVLSCKPTDDGNYLVKLQVNVGLNKLGTKKLLPPDMDVSIALFDKLKPEWDNLTKPVFIKKYRIQHLETKLSLIVHQKPKIAVIDPYCYLLDANLEDNSHEILQR
ncbi:ABC transporter permease/M1 family aminopeptidase [Pedobacter insulae]|uniref:Peptidase family M1 n=1 Tax=Pedobacter insulae TaxID=414048 RepID=A0A1I3A8Z9_9SPHI|nr:M1 family aminopeptidase [Pedobacter insulae]SFH45801.1 Peptidase family M1 [Pedobacter insulae]